MKTFQDILAISVKLPPQASMTCISEIDRLNQPLTYALNSITMATDIIIAATLVILLHRSRTGFKRYEFFLNKKKGYRPWPVNVPLNRVLSFTDRIS